MRFLRHMIEQPFITATGAAALVHSTWALGTLFAGEQPEGWHLWGWLIPALLIAFALDVGQISTSWQIREYGLTFSRGLTFIVFAVATYYLQWLYIVHHMPALELSAGVSEMHHEATVFLRDLALWLIPALLPLSTLLYTLSGGNEPVKRHDAPHITIQAVDDEHAALTEGAAPDEPSDAQDMLEIAHDEPLNYVAECPNCDWRRDGYGTAASADRALRTHQSLHCPVVDHADAE